MVQHVIVIASSYRLGKRIAWHYAADVIDKSVLKELEDKTRTFLGRPDYAIHKLTTDSKDWSSVMNKDSFFEGIHIYDSLAEFLEEISNDKTITALDIAKYLLSVQPMSNLKLQKMIYLVYADYLTRTGKKLFDDKIVAMQYGPVIPEVYQFYKGHGREEIDEGSDEHVVTLNEITMPLALAKILQSDDEESIISSIKSTIEKFGKKTASQLVTITHKEGSPWSKAKDIGLYSEITDDLILAYHAVEMI